jgi:hypothetical protein
MEFKHTILKEHPLVKGRYMVANLTFPYIPPYFGTLKECQKAQISAEKNAQKLLEAQEKKL